MQPERHREVDLINIIISMHNHKTTVYSSNCVGWNVFFKCPLLRSVEWLLCCQLKHKVLFVIVDLKLHQRLICQICHFCIDKVDNMMNWLHDVLSKPPNTAPVSGKDGDVCLENMMFRLDIASWSCCCKYCKGTSCLAHCWTEVPHVFFAGSYARHDHQRDAVGRRSQQTPCLRISEEWQ